MIPTAPAKPVAAAGSPTNVTQPVQKPPPTTPAAGAAVPPMPQDDQAEAAKPAPVIIKYKTNGKEHAVTEAEARKKLELVDGAYGKFEEAAQMRKNAQTVLAAAKEDPFNLIERLHGPERARQLLEAHVAKIVARENLAPEERSRLDLDDQRQSFESERKEFESKKRDEQIAHKAELYKKELLPAMRNSLSRAGVPQNHHAISRLAGMFETMLDAGMPLDAMTMDRAAERLRSEYGTEISGVFKDLDAERLAEWLGEENMTKLRQRDIARAQAGISEGRRAQPSNQRPPPRPPSPSNGIMSIEEYRDRLRSG